MVAFRTQPPSSCGKGGTSVPPPPKLTRSGALARTSMNQRLLVRRSAALPKDPRDRVEYVAAHVLGAPAGRDRLVQQLVTVASQDAYRATASSMACFEVGGLVSNDERAAQINAVIRGRAQQHARVRLATLAPEPRLMRAVVDAVEVHARGLELVAEPLVNGGYGVVGEVSASHAGLVRDDDREYPASVQQTDRLRRTGQQAQPSRVIEIPQLGIQRPVPIQKHCPRGATTSRCGQTRRS